MISRRSIKQDRITRERKGCIAISHVYIILYIELYNSYPTSGKNQPNSFLFDILIFGTYGIRYALDILNDTLAVNLPYPLERLEEDKE